MKNRYLHSILHLNFHVEGEIRLIFIEIRLDAT